MHKSSIMDFKKCFKEKETVVYSRKRITLKHARWGKYQERWKWEENIQTNEHMGSLIELISSWFSQWAFSNVFEFSEISSWSQLCPSRNRRSSCGNPSLIYLCTNRPFWFSARVSLFLGYLFSFFVLFFFTARLKTWTLFKMNENFLFPWGRNSLAQIPAFDPNGLSKYVT